MSILASPGTFCTKMFIIYLNKKPFEGASTSQNCGLQNVYGPKTVCGEGAINTKQSLNGFNLRKLSWRYCLLTKDPIQFPQSLHEWKSHP